MARTNKRTASMMFCLVILISLFPLVGIAEAAENNQIAHAVASGGVQGSAGSQTAAYVDGRSSSKESVTTVSAEATEDTVSDTSTTETEEEGVNYGLIAAIAILCLSAIMTLIAKRRARQEYEREMQSTNKGRNKSSHTSSRRR